MIVYKQYIITFSFRFYFVLQNYLNQEESVLFLSFSSFSFTL